MELVQNSVIKKTTKNKEIFDCLDNYSFMAKNLRNTTNYIIKQCSRISIKSDINRASQIMKKANITINYKD